MKFPFVLNLKLIIFGCPKILAHYSLMIMCLNIGTSKTINFPFGTHGKLMVLGVPILKHFRVNGTVTGEKSITQDILPQTSFGL